MKIAAMKVVIFLLFLFLATNCVSTERLHENEVVESRFSPGYVISIINAMKQLKCDMCRLMFQSDVFCGVVCSLAASNTGTTRNPSGTTTTVATTKTTPAPESCAVEQETSFTTGGKCYKYVSCSISWGEAKAYCESQGLHLLSLEYYDEVEDVDTKIKNTVGITTDYRVWIGMTGSGGVYTRTLDGAANTIPFIPGADQTKACGVLDNNSNKGVNSVDCETRLPFICERQLLCD